MPERNDPRKTLDAELKILFEEKLVQLGATFSSIMRDKILPLEEVPTYRFLLKQLEPYSDAGQFSFTGSKERELTGMGLSEEEIAERTADFLQDEYPAFGALIRVHEQLSDIFKAIDSEGHVDVPFPLSRESYKRKMESLYENYKTKSPREIWIEITSIEFEQTRQNLERRNTQAEITLVAVDEMITTLVGKLM